LMAVRRTTLPGVSILGQGPESGSFSSISSANESNTSEIRDLHVLIYSINGPLYFCNAERLRDSTRRLETYGSFHSHPSAPPQPLIVRTVLFDLAALTSLDVTALEVLVEICQHYLQDKKRVCLCSIPSKVRTKLELAGILDLVGAHNLFPTLKQALAAVEADSTILPSTNL